MHLILNVYKALSCTLYLSFYLIIYHNISNNFDIGIANSTNSIQLN